MKILVLGDIHGRLCWSQIIEKVVPDQVIFLGDYITSHTGISEAQQLANLQDILNYKEEFPDKVILLRGNHDIEALGYSWAQCWPQFLRKNDFPKERFLANTQWVHVHKNIVFSHAGVSQTWLKNAKCYLHEVNRLEPSELFAFTPLSFLDQTGESITQPPTWIRPVSLKQDCLKGFIQVVGHTPVQQCLCNQNLWFCDALEQESFLVIEDDKFKVNDQE